MSLKVKRLLMALFFLILTVFAAVTLVQRDFPPNYILYTLVFAAAFVFVLKNALKP